MTTLAERFASLTEEQQAELARLAGDLVPGGLDRIGKLAEAFLAALPPEYRAQLEPKAVPAPDLLTIALERYR